MIAKVVRPNGQAFDIACDFMIIGQNENIIMYLDGKIVASIPNDSFVFREDITESLKE